ncbi:MAG: toxin HicA [Bdellovibrio sp.]
MNITDALAALENPKNVKFADLLKICRDFFGEPRINGSHHVFKVPWQGEPWVNLQKDGKMAKDYQVKQVKKALSKLEEMRK